MLAMGGVPIREREGAPQPLFVDNIIDTNAALFTSVVGEDFAPAAGSPLHDAGDCAQATVGCNSDYFGRPRGTPPDVGAIEVP